MTFLKPLWRGEVPLPRAFWLYGMSGTAIFVVYSFLCFKLRPPPEAVAMLLGGLAVFSVFVLVVSVGIWRSAGHYSGSAVWVSVIRAALCVAGAVFVLAAATAFTWLPFLMKGFARNSQTVAATIVRDSGHPLAGFWKSSCAENFGFAIEPAGPGEYSIVFCGPGGCFPPGSYRPNTSIVGDPDYRILDANTLEIRSREGFLRITRCQ